MVQPGVLDGREAGRFVGRDAELARLDALLGPEPAAPVFFVSGPGGIGKSSLLREVGRRAVARGLPVHRVDGRAQDTAAEQLSAALGELRRDGPSLLLFDTYEQVPVLGAYLRRELEPCLAAGARVLIAGRQPPDAAWLQDGWGEIVLSTELRPLSDADAGTLIERRGLHDAAAVERLTAWGAGSPLALAVATDAVIAGHLFDLDRIDADALLATTLLQRLAGDELDGADRDIIAVAAIARAVDAALLDSVLPGTDGDHAEAWLRTLSFAEPIGTRVTLHDRVRRAVRGALVAQDPEHERVLRRRIADHVHDRASSGELRLIADLAELVQDPQVRWGLAPPPVTHRGDRVRPGDAERVAEVLGLAEDPSWPGIRRWFDEAPEQVLVVRDADDGLAGYGIWATPATAPPWVGEDAVFGPWIEDARRRVPDGNVILLRDAADLTRSPGDRGPSAVITTGNYAALLRCGLASPRWLYATVAADDVEGQEFLRAMGYARVPELDVVDHGREVASYHLDFGPGGIVSRVRDMVYAELGLPPAAIVENGMGTADTVRQALRTFHDPIALAASPLAHGDTIDERAETVRRTLREATAAAFGDSSAERLQRAVVEHGYLNARDGHARAMLDLNVSRSTYFRRLAEASDRVAAYVLARRV